jgi:hypothetical protein
VLSFFTVMAKPDWGLLAVAAWTMICLGLHALQIIQAFSVKRTAGPLDPWMTKP